MKVSDINVTKQERLEPRKYYNEEQLIELFGIGDKKSPVKQSDVSKVLQNIELRKSGTHPVRFKDGEVVEIDPKLATRINNWLAKRDPKDIKSDEKMVSSWEGFQKIAKLLGIENMLPKPKSAYAKSDDELDRMIQLAGLGEGYYKLPDFDSDKYQKRDGLEGPIPTRSGKVLYYDPKEGMYYDPDTDMFVDYDEFRKYDEVSWMDKSQDTMEAKPGDSMGMNKYGISAVHKDGKFYAFRNGKKVGGPFDTIEQLADFQKKSIENEDAQQELPLPVNYTFTKTDFLDNEAENMHTENAVELAMMFGTKEEQKRMNIIMTAHNTRGYILPDEQEERDALVRKYYPMLEDVVEGDGFGSAPKPTVRKPVRYDPKSKMPFIMKYAYQPDVTRALRKAAGLSDDAPVYFDDVDLVYGDETVIPNCSVDNNCTFGDAVKVLKKFVEDVNKWPGDPEIDHDPNINITTGKPHSKTVMGVGVRSKEDKIKDKKRSNCSSKT